MVTVGIVIDFYNQGSKVWNKIQIIILITISVTSFVSSWDGYDYDSGSYVEIDKGNLVHRDLSL